MSAFLNKNKKVGKTSVTKKKRRKKMAKNMLTTKEMTLVSDLLMYEESACKKARLYSKTLLDKSVAEDFSKIAAEHEKRFNALLNLL